MMPEAHDDCLLPTSAHDTHWFDFPGKSLVTVFSGIFRHFDGGMSNATVPGTWLIVSHPFVSSFLSQLPHYPSHDFFSQ